MARIRTLPPAPRPARHPKDVTVHGDRRIDDYFWLRERDNPQVLEHLKAENAYAQAWFEPLADFKSQLYDEMLARIQEDDEAVPYRKGDWWYLTRTVKGLAYPLHVRRRGAPDGPEQLLLDLNELARGKPFLQAGVLSVSPDASRLAYALDETGSLDFTLRIRHIDSGELLPLQVANVRGAAWANDSRTLFVLTHDEAKRTACVWRHDVTRNEPGVKVYEDRNALFWVGLGKTLDQRWIIIHSDSADTSELRVLPADKPTARQRIVLPRRKGREASLEHREGLFYLRINDTGPNFRLVTVPARRPDLAQAVELVAHRPQVYLEDFDVFQRHLVLAERDGGVQKLCVWDLASGERHHIAFDETVYSTHGQHNAEFDTDVYRLNFISLTTPSSVFDYAMPQRQLSLKKRQPVLGGFAREHYAARQIHATAADGQRVPVSLVWRVDRHQPGTPMPLLLYGYGAYGIPNDVNFPSTRLSLLDRGGVLALAHIRGGTDLGRVWYDDGKLTRKMNTFTDFIACAEALIAQGWTTPGQLAIEGGSAGGLLMGAVANLRPELFRAVVAQVPFVDVINTMLDETLPLTTGEFLEWGNPKKKADYANIRAYSPYDNLAARAYPAFYLRAGLNDSQVPYWEAAKFAARLRDLKTDAHPVVFSVNLEAGHGGASGRYEALKERAEALCFVLAQLGLAPAITDAPAEAAAPAPAAGN
ncbi:MAG: S9 family peptidase [Rubrivivax sp.]|nr:S9 family peptidase [Rubrivivax sp.]